MDATYDYEVWNQPVDSYIVESLREITEREAIELLVTDPSTVSAYPYNEKARAFAAMLMAKGQRPTPKISPCCVFERLNSAPHSPMTWARTMKPKAVAMRAMKHPQNSFISGSDS